MMYGGYGAGGPGMGGPSPSGLGGYGEASTRQRRPIEDLTEGKLFVGGLSYETTQQSFEDYCAQWCVSRKQFEISDRYTLGSARAWTACSVQGSAQPPAPHCFQPYLDTPL